MTIGTLAGGRGAQLRIRAEALRGRGQRCRADVLIDNSPFTVIGVAPPGFLGVDPSKAPDLYLPLHADLLLEPEKDPESVGRYLDEHYYWTEMMGRLRPGVTLAQAQAGWHRYSMPGLPLRQPTDGNERIFRSSAAGRRGGPG